MYGENLETIPPGVDGQAALEEVRRRVNGPDGPAPNSAEASIPYMRSDHMLVRFLIARQWDVEQATTLLREHYQWLAEKKMEELVLRPFPEEPQLKKYYPETYHGTDKFGRPVYIWQPGFIDMPRLLQATTPDRLMEYLFANSELQIRRRLPACSLARGEVVDKSLNIIDLENLGFFIISDATAYRVLREYTAAITNHYPETMGKVVIINAPRLFYTAWTVVKGLLDDKTKAKIEIFGTNQRAYSKALLELVDRKQLPALFGGECKCDGKNPKSCMTTLKGPWTNPEIATLLDSQPLEYLMTPEGAKLLTQGRPSQEDVVSPAEGDIPTENLQSDQNLLESHSPEVTMAERVVQELREEYRKKLDLHMQTLIQWVEEFNRHMQDIGRLVIERAQGYYDARELWNESAQEYALQQGEVDTLTDSFKQAAAVLKEAEAAIEASSSRCGPELSAEDWAKLIPMEADEANLPDNPKLACTFRVAALVDRMLSLQQQRDAALHKLEIRSRELEEARNSFDEEEQKHSTCTLNCSVTRAAPFFERRLMHKGNVDAQAAGLRAVEKQMHEAQCRLETLCAGKETAPSWCSFEAADELSLKEFEPLLPDQQPSENEDVFVDCNSDISS